MALANDIVLNDVLPSTVARTFSLVDIVNGIRLDLSTTLANARKMLIKHRSQAVKGVGTIDTHLVSFTHDIVGTDMVTRTLVVNCTMSVPRDTSVTTNHVQNLVDMAKQFLTQANVTKLLVNDK